MAAAAILQCCRCSRCLCQFPLYLGSLGELIELAVVVLATKDIHQLSSKPAPEWMAYKSRLRIVSSSSYSGSFSRFMHVLAVGRRS